jgi:gas vesicle protein
MFRMVKNLKVVLGKEKCGVSKKTKKVGKNAEKNVENNGNETSGSLKKRSIFWNVPYWKDLMVRHSIDVMHVEKDMCEALVDTLLDIPGKIKDTVNAWMNLKEMKLRKDLHHETLENG